MPYYAILILLTSLTFPVHHADAGEAGQVELVAGVENVEDMVAIPSSDWIIGSGVGNWRFHSGGLHLINSQSLRAIRVDPGLHAELTPEAPYDRCSGPPDAALFSAHGLSLVSREGGIFRLFVVNHGGRDSIEVFDVTATESQPTFKWAGCIPCPEGTFPNGVAGRRDGGVVMSSTYHANGLWERLTDNRGGVFIWMPGGAWSKVPNSALPQNNGIVLSDDERWAFVVSMPDASVTYLPLEPGLGDSRRIPLAFNPDNIRRAYDGRLVVAGVEHTGLHFVNLCVVANYAHCRIDFRADAIDPGTFEVSHLYSGTGSEGFGLATVGLLTPEALWFGSVRSRHVLKVSLD